MDVPQDDFKWFGEGFDGFPRRLPEDCVEYTLYIVSPKSHSNFDVHARLGQVLAASNDLTSKLLDVYIWQRDPFVLELRDGEGTPYLHGQTNHGDSVDDEWLIVYLLRELSRRFSDLWITVVDADGEFLLIEAANALPGWLNPEIASNRVWLNNGRLSIIPLSDDASGSVNVSACPASLSIAQAKDFIRDRSGRLLQSPVIESEAFYRIRNYPDQIGANLHHATIIIPRKLAYVLHEQPNTISQAVEALYLRDPISLRPLQSRTSETMEALHFPPHDLVTTSVKFSKVGYAQLKSQQLQVPAWESALPKKHDPKIYSMAETGMKVSCGYEMLVTDPQNREREPVQKLKQLSFAIKSGKLQLPSDEEILGWDLREDDESWLDINFEDFENELSGVSKGKDSKSTTSKGFGDKAAQENLQKMVERFEKFLNDDAAGVAGADLHDTMDDDDDGDDDDDDKYSDVTSEGEDKDVSFDETEFARVMREMMGMPPEEEPKQLKPHSNLEDHSRIQNLDSEDDDHNEDQDEIGEDMRDVMRRMEAELNESGALDLDPTPKKIAATRNAIKEDTENKTIQQVQLGNQHENDDGDDDEHDDKELDIDYNLVKNMLESFKGQAGMAGPGGNLLGLMGMQLPRDEDEDDTVNGIDT
ncbi:MAG: hypothetical protein M1837_005196 [Sclerophora amabilis]|nr:MAG: hypothetical protein M1837_005196 [Sclerophora amabilis]